jgi:hypothetical protein
VKIATQLVKVVCPGHGTERTIRGSGADALAPRAERTPYPSPGGHQMGWYQSRASSFPCICGGGRKGSCLEGRRRTKRSTKGRRSDKHFSYVSTGNPPRSVQRRMGAGPAWP